MPDISNYSSYYQDKTILVTGGLGYIGSSVIGMLSGLACNIIVADKVSRGLRGFPEAAAKISLIEADIRERDIWRGLLDDVDILFHFAAQTSSKISNDNPLRDTEMNLLPIISLVETCQKDKVSPRIIFSGTATQVGFTEDFPVNEDFKDLPVTVYDINKLAAEKYLQYYGSQLKNKAVTLRLANVYGPGPRSSSADRGILNLMVQKAIKGEAITIYGDGNFIRDYVYIDDVARAFLSAGANIEKLSGNYFIVGSGEGHTIAEAFTLIRDIAKEKTGKASQILHVPLPEGLSKIEYRNFVADVAKFNDVTGWSPKVSLKQGIEQTLDYYLKEARV